MFEINFKVKNISITDNKEDMYYMVSLADSKDSNPSNYLIFQKTYDPDELEEESELSEPYIECNGGESCYNCCNLLTFNKDELQFEVNGTKFQYYLTIWNLIVKSLLK